jgi:energy-coupling factor transport system ATP-binding protein
MDDIINTYAEKVRMTKYLDHEPTRLSGGQKQRVAIAGILAMKPDILIFDEATSMLDPQGRDDIKRVIRQLHEESSLTIISITHDIEEVTTADYVVAMNKGHVAMCGTPQELFSAPEQVKKIRLELPFAMKMREALKKEGIKLNKRITMEGLVEELCRYDSNT